MEKILAITLILTMLVSIESSNTFEDCDPKGKYQRQKDFMTMHRIWETIDSVDTSNAKEIEDFLTLEPYQEDYMALYYGTKTTNDGEEKLQKNIYYRVVDDNIQIREDFYSDRGYMNSGMIDCIQIFNNTDYTTFTRMYRFSDYAQTINGNWLEFKYLEPNSFEEMKVAEDVKEFNAIFHNESGVIEITQILSDDTIIKIDYSAINFMPIYYKKTIPDGANKIVIEYELFKTNEDYDILDFIMDPEGIK